MIAFRDRTGRQWAARLDVDGAARMRVLAGVDVMRFAVDQQAAEEFARLDPATSAAIADAIFCLFLPQCGPITGRQFGKRLRAVSALELRELFFEGITAFFEMPGPPAEPSEDDEPRTATAAELWRDVYRLAGEAGIDPGPRTYGELAAIADGRRRAEWARTAALRADIINASPNRSGEAVHPAELDPTGALKEAGGGHGQQMEITADDIGFLALIFS